MSLRMRKTVRLETKAFGAKRFQVMLQICNTGHKGLDWQIGIDAEKKIAIVLQMHSAYSSTYFFRFWLTLNIPKSAD